MSPSRRSQCAIPALLAALAVPLSGALVYSQFQPGNRPGGQSGGGQSFQGGQSGGGRQSFQGGQSGSRQSFQGSRPPTSSAARPSISSGSRQSSGGRPGTTTQQDTSSRRGTVQKATGTTTQRRAVQQSTGTTSRGAVQKSTTKGTVQKSTGTTQKGTVQKSTGSTVKGTVQKSTTKGTVQKSTGSTGKKATVQKSDTKGSTSSVRTQSDKRPSDRAGVKKATDKRPVAKGDKRVTEKTTVRTQDKKTADKKAVSGTKKAVDTKTSKDARKTADRLTAKDTKKQVDELRRKAQARQDAERKARLEADRRRKEALQKLPPDQRKRVEQLTQQQKVLADKLKRQNEQAKKETLKKPATGPSKADKRLFGADTRRAQARAIEDKTSIERLGQLARNSKDPLARAAARKVLGGEPLSRAEREALRGVRDRVLADTTISEAERANRLKAISDAIAEDRRVRRDLWFQQSLGTLVGGGLQVVPPVVVDGGPFVAGVVPALPSVVIPPVAPDDGSCVVQVVPQTLVGGASSAVAADVPAAAALADDGAAVPQTTRYLRLANATKRRVVFNVRYRTETEDGQFAWFPPKEEEPLQLELEPGEEADVLDNDWRVHADRAYVWAEADGRAWTNFQKKPLWLVPEVDAEGNHAYEAPARDVFTFTVR